VIEQLQKMQLLRNFHGEPSQFWNMYLEALMGLCKAKAGVICLLDPKQEWITLAYQPQSTGFEAYIRIFLNLLPDCHAHCLKNGSATFTTPEYVVIAAPLIVDSQVGNCLFLGYLPQSTEPVARKAIQAVQTSADLFAQYRIRQSTSDSVTQKNHLASVLDVTRLVSSNDRFLAAAMTLVNELATRHKCDRVSLGWEQKGYVRVRAMSHTDSFEKKMEVVRNLENAMEEALDQDADIVWPQPAQPREIARAHELYAKSHDAGNMLSVLVRMGSEVVGVVSLERSTAPFSEDDTKLLRITVDQVSKRLADLRFSDRWFGVVWADQVRKSIAKLFGFEHTWIKLFALVFLGFALFACLVPIHYRVDAPMILRTDKVLFVTAPFEGYIDSVSVKPGDMVQKGQELLRLDQKELTLQESDLMAEAQNYEREIQKAQAEEELAQMRIFAAKLEQTEAKLNTIRFKLEQSVIRSGFDRAVVIEGDLKKRIGAPINQGGELFRIALIENIYAEIDVDESEIQNIRQPVEGQIALKSMPDEAYRIRVLRINPAATVKDNENTFQVRADFVRKVPDWFRPGMTGVAKIDAGKHTLWWILTHRAIDFLLLKLWW
jgi:hypothetical protein